MKILIKIFLSSSNYFFLPKNFSAAYFYLDLAAALGYNNFY